MKSRKFLWLLVIMTISLSSCQPEPVTSNPLDNKNDLTVSSYVSPDSVSNMTFDHEVPERFELVSKNSLLELYVEKATMAIAVRNIKNGYLMASYDVYRDFDTEISENKTTAEIVNQMKSGVLITTYSVFTPNQRTLLDKDVLGNKAANIQYTINTNGFIAKIDFTRIKISFNVEVTLENNHIVVTVPRDSISEYDQKLWSAGNNDIILSDISVYPYFGSIESATDGYAVIPDGSGALIGLKETPKYTLGYSAPVYGRDLGYLEPPTVSEVGVETVRPLNRVTMPLYGLIHHQGNAGVAVFIEEGENYATVNYVPKGLATKYYQTYFNYSYRTSYRQFQSRVNKEQYILGFQTEPNNFDIKQHYVILEDNADYVGVAKEYRNWLINEERLSKRPTSDGISTQITVIGTEIKQGIIGKQKVVVSTFDGTRKLLEEITNDGFDELVVTYKMLDKDKASVRFSADGSLGGSNAFNKLKEFVKNNDITFEVSADYFTSYHNSIDVALRLSKNALYTLTYNKVYPNRYIIKTEKANDYFNAQKEMFNRLGITSVALTGLEYAIYTSSKDTRKAISSSVNKANILTLLENIENNGIEISAYNPDSYLFGYVSRYYEMPITSSNILSSDATIPLLQLVLGGSANMYSTPLNFISNEIGTLLRMAEYGVNPSYVLTSGSTSLLRNTNSDNVYISNYKDLRDRMMSNKAFLEEALVASASGELNYHTFPLSGVSLSRFGNKVVLVNYNSNSVTYEGHNVPSRGYIVYEE